MNDQISTNLLKLRRAEAKDAEAILSWRNAPIVRNGAFNDKIISLHEHTKWFKESLANKNRIILIGEEDDQPIGVLRYDISDLTAEVSIYLVPDCTHKGLGTTLLAEGSAWLKEHYPYIKYIQAKVLHRNEASLKAFQKAGFDPFYVVFQTNLTDER